MFVQCVDFCVQPENMHSTTTKKIAEDHAQPHFVYQKVVMFNFKDYTITIDTIFNKQKCLKNI
jgi:hypothetical protein